MFHRFVVSSLCLVVIVSAAGFTQEPLSMHAPFRDLHTVDGVSTSNDEYAISLYWSPQRLRIDYPDGRGPFERDPADAGELYTALSVFCRADGRPEGFRGPRPVAARLSLPMHPGGAGRLFRAAPDVLAARAHGARVPPPAGRGRPLTVAATAATREARPLSDRLLACEGEQSRTTNGPLRKARVLPPTR